MPRFGLRTLFSSVTLLAVLCWIPVACRGCYYADRNSITELLSHYPEVENVSIDGIDDDLAEEILVTSFTIRGRPDAILGVRGLEDSWNGSFRHLYLSRIGSLGFVVKGYGHIGVWDTKTGEPVKSEFWKDVVDVGPDSEFTGVLPFTVSTLDELIERYDELQAYFQTWPKSDSPGTHQNSDGTELSYYVAVVK